MNTVLLAAYIVSILTLLMTPGPVIALVTRAAMQEGYGRAIRTMIGTSLASLTLIAVAALMLTGIVALDPRWLAGLGVTGALYIAVLAVSGLREHRRGMSGGEASVPMANSGLVAGYLTGVANPKDILFFVAFFPQFIAVTRDLSTSLLLLTLTWVLLDLSVLSLYILAVKRWLPTRRARGMALFSACFLLLVAVLSLFYNGRTLLRSATENTAQSLQSKTFRAEHYTTNFSIHYFQVSY